MGEKSEELSNQDIDAMGEDELMETPEQETTETEAMPPESTQDSAEQEPETDDEPAKEPEQEQKAEIKFEDLPPEGKVEHLQKRISDLQAGYTKEHLSNLEKERQIKELEIQKKQEQVEGFEPLAEDELKELRNIDEQAYERYEQEKKEYEQRKQEVEKEAVEYVKQSQDQEITAFIESEFGIKIDTNLPIEQQPEEVKKVDAEIAKVAEYLLQKHKRLGGNGKFYTRDQFVDAHKVVNFQEIMAREKAKGADVAVSAIERAKKGGSNFDRHRSSAGGRPGVKHMDDYSQDEIDEMSEDELNSLVED